MGFSANQARFLSLTSRQVDLEYRMQQICHRRLRLASELEDIATDYNNKLSDRKLFAMDNSLGISALTNAKLGNYNYTSYYTNTSGTNVAISGEPTAANLETWGLLDNAGDLPDGMSPLEYGLRTGNIRLARPGDEFTQEYVANIGGGNTLEQVDWRTTTEIADELYKANDVDAETEYEAAIEKINAQDKKLQLEQSQIEVEHKAITTQKDAVKQIINKNIETSFKTFS